MATWFSNYWRWLDTDFNISYRVECNKKEHITLRADKTNRYKHQWKVRELKVGSFYSTTNRFEKIMNCEQKPKSRTKIEYGIVLKFISIGNIVNIDQSPISLRILVIKKEQQHTNHQRSFFNIEVNKNTTVQKKEQPNHDGNCE